MAFTMAAPAGRFSFAEDDFGEPGAERVMIAFAKPRSSKWQMLEALDGLRRREFARFHGFQNFSNNSSDFIGSVDTNSNTARGQLLKLDLPDAAGD